ncbi:ribokinase [Leifsonia sp. fls2-241-R2A-40a]|uniref:ribokinase n=1 Tax=Leifsonia sp. fls2-241-R2A-40a TaxID=3040290 RepID=UPI00254EFB21|nr:ribokinase [Leifsonia sp. fls2-241-R2A-40a]
MSRFLLPTPAVAVVGSANLDIVVRVARAPRAGETLLGTGYETAPGGKGLNQALAAAAVAATSFVGALGDDDAGRRLLDELTAHRVDVTQVVTAPQPTGRAVISVTPDGENSIVVIPLANSELTGGQVEAALNARMPQVVLCQCEVPSEAVRAAAGWALQNGARFILNASPAPGVDPRVLSSADPVIVNLEEAAVLVDLPEQASPGTIAERLRPLVRSSVVTLGARGAWVDDGTAGRSIAPVAVAAVDTTGAGDAFAGTLAAELAVGKDLLDAARSANAAAARIVGAPRSERGRSQVIDG